MISSLLLKFGSAPNTDPLHINTTPLTIFVGPNNSGKSRVLTEIEQLCLSGDKQSGALVLDDLEFVPIESDKLDAVIATVEQKPGISESSIAAGHILTASKNNRVVAHLAQLHNALQNPSRQRHQFCQWFLCHRTLKLDGANRIALVRPQAAGDLQTPQHNTLSVLFRDDKKRQEVRRIVHEAFGQYFVIDPTNLGHLRIRLSDRAPDTESEERGIDAKAVAFHAAAKLIDQASDGVKAFTGILTEVVAGNPSVILMDEPEAFLHPSLAFKLGLEVSKAVGNSDKRLFVATHSPSFLMGCIQSGIPINIVRLTYRNGSATARALPSSEIVSLMRNPLLRSTNVLAGLFAEFVVVTEADADRAFYQEINERLNRDKPEWGVPNCLFLHAQNKQTIPTIVTPLRRLGIPVAGITDVDILKEGGSVWASLLEAAGFPSIEKNSLASLRGPINAALVATGRDMKRDGGIEILDGSDKEAAQNLLERMATYGIFVVPKGELESWLKSLNVSGHGPVWLIKMFEKMGEDPESAPYLRPSSDDVWHFISMIRGWLMDPQRKGIAG